MSLAPGGPPGGPLGWRVWDSRERRKSGHTRGTRRAATVAAGRRRVFGENYCLEGGWGGERCRPHGARLVARVRRHPRR